MQTVDTVAAFRSVVDTYVHTRIGYGSVLPYVTVSLLQTLVLVFHKRWIDIHYIRDDTVLFRTVHDERIVQDSRFTHYYRTGTQSHRVARTDGVMTGLFDSVFSMHTRRCCKQ